MQKRLESVAKNGKLFLSVPGTGTKLIGWIWDLGPGKITLMILDPRLGLNNAKWNCIHYKQKSKKNLDFYSFVTSL